VLSCHKKFGLQSSSSPLSSQTPSNPTAKTSKLTKSTSEKIKSYQTNEIAINGKRRSKVFIVMLQVEYERRKDFKI